MNDSDREAYDRAVSAAVRQAVEKSVIVGAAVLSIPAADGLVIYWFKSGRLANHSVYSYN